MVSKIFQILESVKKSSNITKSISIDSVEKIVNQITSGDINPVEAYVILDYLKKVTEESVKCIKANTIDYIKNEGDNRAFGVELQLIARKDYSFEDDAEWSRIDKQMSLYKDALKAREELIKMNVESSIENGVKSPVGFTTSIMIRPKIS